MISTAKEIDTVATVLDVVVVEPLCEATIVVTSFKLFGLLL